MSKRIFFIFFGVLCLIAGLHADEKTAVWERIYRNSISDDMRYAVMLNIKELNDRSFGALLTEALGDLISRRIELGDANEVASKVKLTTLVVQELGELKEAGAADQIYQVYKEVKNYPLLRTEALLALGKIHTAEYAGPLSKDLAALNSTTDRTNQSSMEIVAFGLVQALAMMHDPQGFEPLFFASIGWYSPERSVKETAKKLLKNVVDDPTDSLVRIIKTQNNFVNKLLALEAEDESKASAAQKSAAALATLDDVLRQIPANVVQATQLSEVRKKSLGMLVQYGDKSSTAPALYRSQYKAAILAKDSGETLAVIQALGVNGTSDAVGILSELLSGFNEREKSKLITDFDVQQVRTILQAMKAAGSAAARPVLLEAQFLYTPALQREIKAVLASLPTN